MNAYLLGELVGAALPPALVVFFVARKQTAGVVPYLAAVGAGLAGVGGLFLFNAATHRLGTSDADIHEFETGFTNSCVPSCVNSGAADPPCRTICACVLSRLHARYPSNEQFAHWFRTADTSKETVKKEAMELSAGCAQASR